MTAEKKLVPPKRRTRAEVQQLVTEFVSSSMRRSEFCRIRGLSLSTSAVAEEVSTEAAKQLLTYTVNMPRVLMGFEACSGAHFLGRAFESNATMLG